MFKGLYDKGGQEHSLLANHCPTPQPPVLTDGPPPGFHMVTYGQFHQSTIDILFRCDGAWDKTSHLAVATWVADISYSDYQVHESQVMRATSALQVEAHACRLGLLWAKHNSFENVIVYTDSANLISTISSASSTLSYLQHTISDIKHMATSLRGCCIMKVGRADVAVAHDLAKSSRNPSLPFVAH